MPCAPEQLVPQGPGTDPAYQGCSLPGAAVNARNVEGSAYLATSFEYSRSNLWRNFGGPYCRPIRQVSFALNMLTLLPVVILFSLLYVLITVFAVETFNFAAAGGGALVFKRSKKSKKAVQEGAAATDEEKAATGGSSDSSSTMNGETPEEAEALESITKSESIFTWQNVEYTVPYNGGERKLLNQVSGYVKPGMMVALVGASGAGKTTLLNTLAQRQRTGVIAGEMKVDGMPLGLEFQRGTGFCEQMDLHDMTATVCSA